MFKKGIITVLVVAFGVFGFGLAHAAQIDGLQSNNGPTLPVDDFSGPLQVYVNPGGLGDALIYGYYNVRDNRVNVFTLIHTTATYWGVRARIRFFEASDDPEQCGGDGGGSVEVLDFDICLSPGDIWTGSIANVNGVATLFSADDDTYVDTTDPRGGAVIFADAYPNGVEFKYAAAGVTADQTLEGYFYVIASNLLVPDAAGNCGDQDDQLTEVGNSLMGHNYAIDLDDLATYAYNATALGDFSNSAFPDAPLAATPNLGDAVPDGLLGVNYALTKSNLYALYALEPTMSANGTEVIVTFPTRALTCVSGPLNDIFDDPRVLITVWDDEENLNEAEGCEFSPCPPGIDTNLPYEVNVLNLDNSGIFDSTVEVALSGDDVPFDFGWINIDLVNALTSSPNPAHFTTFGGPTGITRTSNGLPAIGYVVLDVLDSDVSHMLPLQYSSDIN